MELREGLLLFKVTLGNAERVAFLIYSNRKVYLAHAKLLPTNLKESGGEGSPLHKRQTFKSASRKLVPQGF